jgi:hypothetical protein
MFAHSLLIVESFAHFMQPALFFRLIFPPPSSRPEIFTLAYSTGAGRAAYAGETPVVQYIVGYMLLFYIIFYLVKRPAI